MDEGALGRLHLRTGVVQSLAAPHDGTQRFLQRAVQLGLVQPVEATRTETGSGTGRFLTHSGISTEVSAQKNVEKGCESKKVCFRWCAGLFPIVFMIILNITMAIL